MMSREIYPGVSRISPLWIQFPSNNIVSLRSSIDSSLSLPRYSTLVLDEDENRFFRSAPIHASSFLRLLNVACKSLFEHVYIYMYVKIEREREGIVGEEGMARKGRGGPDSRRSGRGSESVVTTQGKKVVGATRPPFHAILPFTPLASPPFPSPPFFSLCYRSSLSSRGILAPRFIPSIPVRPWHGNGRRVISK